MPTSRSSSTADRNTGAPTKAPAAPARKTRITPTAKRVAKEPTAVPVAAKAVGAVKVEKVEKTVKVERKAERPRLVRDGFTMPGADFALIAVLKERALNSQRSAKKSELLRAGLHALAALDAKALVAALASLEPVKTGRPKKGR